MRRYYLETKTEAEADLLQRVCRDLGLSMVEVDIPHRNETLLRAISEETGVEVARIFMNDRTRYAVMARTIYTHYAREAGDGIEQLAADFHRSRKAVTFYLRDYLSKMRWDAEFKRTEMRVFRRLRSGMDKTPPEQKEANVSENKEK